MHLKQKQFNADTTHLLADISKPPYIQTVIGQRLTDTARIASQELTSREKLFSRAILLGSIACMSAYEWGPGNEMLAGYIGVSAQEAWADPNSVRALLASSLAVGALTGYLTGAQQAVSGTLMAGGVRIFPNTFKKWNETKKHQTSEIKKEQGDMATALILGTSAAIIEQNARDPERTFKKDAKMALGMAAVIGTFNTALITAVSAGAQVMDKVGWSSAADMTENIAKNPLTYIGAFGAIKGAQYIKEQRKLKKFNQELPID